MTTPGDPIATLILPDTKGLNPGPYIDDICNIIAEHDAVPVRLLKDRIFGESFVVSVSADEDGDYGPSVEISFLSPDGAPARDEMAQWLLARIVLTASEHSPFDLLNWLARDELIDREAFLEECREAGMRPFAKADELSELRGELTGTEPAPETGTSILNPDQERSSADSRYGAAGWLMTAALSIVSAPAALAFGTFALVKGMDFRLATHVLALSVLFLALANTERLTVIARVLLN